jgi:hypothetical protein
MGLSDEQKKELNRKKRDENAAHAYEQILGELGFANVGASVSRKEREETHQLGTPHLRYAEAGFDPVKVVLDKIQDTYGKPNVGHSGPGGRLQRDGEAVFYDLGSGMGKAALAAAVCFSFKRCVGYERLEGLHTLAAAVKKNYDRLAPDVIPNMQKMGEEIADPVDLPELEFFNGNFLTKDYADADVVFCHCTAFDDDGVSDLMMCLSTMSAGAFVVTTTHMLPENSAFDTVDNSVQWMDGIEALVFIAQKRAG